MRFPYQQYATAPTATCPQGLLYRPEIQLRIIGATGDFPTLALVDAGSDDTLIPLSVGQIIGAWMDTTQKWHVMGIGGQITPIILGEVELELNEGNQTMRWAAKVGFLDFADPRDEMALVGHAGFLDYFRVTLDGHLRMLEIEVTPAFPGKVL